MGIYTRKNSREFIIFHMGNFSGNLLFLTGKFSGENFPLKTLDRGSYNLYRARLVYIFCEKLTFTETKLLASIKAIGK